MRKNNLTASLALLVLLAVIAPAHAQRGGSLVIPVRMVEGHLMVVGYITNRRGDVNDLSLEISFADPGVLTLHRDQHQWLRRPAQVKLMLKPDVELLLSGAEVKAETRPEREDLQNSLTRFHSNQLDEHKAKGTLGTGFLSKYHVVLDADAGTLTLSAPEAGAPLQGDVVRRFERRQGLIRLPVRYADAKFGSMLLGGDNYDTWISREIARELGKPAGDVSPLWLDEEGTIDLSRQMAFRPGTFTDDENKSDDNAVLITGVNFLASFRVEVDWLRSTIAFTRTRRPEYPAADFAFFQARATGGAAPLEAYLERYPKARLSAEAARLLITTRLRDPAPASEDELIAALQWVADTAPPKRRMEHCMPYVRRFHHLPDERPALVIRAGKLALRYSRDAITVQDTYRLHNIIGEAYLRQDQLTEAWKHFLSAAFMPLHDRSDGIHNIAVNYNLARVYDRMGRDARAYSRYVMTREMIEPISARVEAVDDAALAEMPDAERAEVTMLKQAIIDVKEAIGRLRQRIPAEELEMLEG